MNQSYIYTTCPLPFGLPSNSGHHRALSRVPCAVQYVLISHLFLWVSSVYVSIPDFHFLSPSLLFMLNLSPKVAFIFRVPLTTSVVFTLSFQYAGLLKFQSSNLLSQPSLVP